MRKEKVIRIAIVDDETVICDLIAHYISQWCTAQNITAKIDSFESAEAFSFEWETSRAYDVVLLDIQMKGASGIVLAKQIRNVDQWLRIVFITGVADYVYEGYEVSALNYLLKPVSKDKLFTCLTRAYEAIKSELEDEDSPRYLFESEGKILRLEQRDIHFVEAQKNYTFIYTAQETFSLKKTFSEVTQALNASLFIKTHRSYLVGVMYIKYIDQQEVVLDDGRKVLLSRNRRRDVQKAFITYHKDFERNSL